MIFNAAPLLKKLRTNGGTYISFSSTNNDISATSMNEYIHMVPSKFVALKLPEWNNLSNVQHLWKDPATYGNPFTTDPNTLFPKTIQNYIENCLQYSYHFRNDTQSLKNPAESYFWKMLRVLEGFELRETGQITIINSQPYPIFEEDINFKPNYENVIKFVGDLNVLNFVRKDGQAYTEVYVHIPTHAGLTKNVKFLTRLIEYTQSDIPNSGEAGAETVGLEDYDDQNNLAIFDDDLERTYEVNSDKDQCGVWFENVEQDPTNNYNKGNFQFNAILVYYDIWDERDMSTKTRNLHGILFLDDFEDSGSGGQILKLFDKYQPEQGSMGNAFGMRINLKMSNSTNQVDSEITINEYSTVSMAIYMDALRKLNDVTALYVKLDHQFNFLYEKVMSLYQYMPRLLELDSYEQRVSNLEQAVYDNVKTERISNEDLFTLFQRLSTQLEEGSTPVMIQQIVGMIRFNDAGEPIIQSPDGKLWVWDPITESWIEQI